MEPAPLIALIDDDPVWAQTVANLLRTKGFPAGRARFFRFLSSAMQRPGAEDSEHAPSAPAWTKLRIMID
jgi:hypothetical protein